MRRIAPDLGDTPLAPTPPDRHTGVAVTHLFTEGRARWARCSCGCPFFMNLLILYFILSWLPSLLRQAGMPVTAGITAVLSLQHRRHRRHDPAGTADERRSACSRRSSASSSPRSALVILASQIFANFPVMMAVTFVLGVTVQGAQAGINALSAMYYPTVIRSTGVGWALGIGRIGSIIGPIIGGLMLAAQWTPQQIFMAGAVPALCAAAAVLASAKLQGSASPFRPEEATAGTGTRSRS